MNKINSDNFYNLNPIFADRLYELAKEYSVSRDALINIAVRKFIEDIDLLRDLRIGKVKSD